MLTGSSGGWSIRRAAAALDMHEDGDFSESAQLAKAARRYHRIAGALNTRTGALKATAGLPFQVEPSDRGDQRRARSIAAQTKARWWDVCPETTIASLLEDAIMLDRAVGFLTWKSVKVDGKSQWLPKVNHLPARGLSYRELEQAWYYNGADGPEKITPGDGTWFLHLPASVQPPFGGAILSLGVLYVISHFTERDWARWGEKLGFPMLAIKEPAFAADDVEANVQGFYDQFKKLGKEPIIREPQGSDGTGWESRWIESSGVGWQSFRAHLAYVGDASEYTVTGMTPRGDQPLGGDGESVRERVRVEYLAADAEPMSTSLREQVWMPIGRYNDSAWDDELAAWGRWDTKPPANMVVRADILGKAATFIPQLVSLGADPEALLDEFRIPRKAGAALPKQEAAPKPAPPEQQQPEEETP